MLDNEDVVAEDREATRDGSMIVCAVVVRNDSRSSTVEHSSRQIVFFAGRFRANRSEGVDV